MGMRETNGMAFVGLNSKKERKDGFLRVNPSNARTELRLSRLDVFDDISLEKMV